MKTTNGMVPDENAFGTGNSFLDEFFDFLVVTIDDAFLIVKGLLRRDMANELEAILVQAGILLERSSSCIMNDSRVRPHFDIGFRSAIGRVVNVFESRFRVKMDAVVENGLYVWHGEGEMSG